MLIKTFSVLLLALSLFQAHAQTKYSIVENKAEKRIDIAVDGKPFTSYIYPGVLMKPVLYPLRTTKGTLVTRGWPLDPRPEERVDHPHHVGMWFNYGNVNGLDFWNNSTAIPPERKKDFGTIKHVAVEKIKASNKNAELAVLKDWQSPDGKSLLRSEEHTSELQSRENLVCRLLLEIQYDRQNVHTFPTRRSSDLFNYGNVNGLDFWNNSTAIPPERKKDFGTIKHVAVEKIKASNKNAELAVLKDWQSPDGKSLL